ncbi:hypothetical protein PR048_009441 [Dryococelus australis]|uniref:PiggyBac transposable element-derived protein domain-containing protein n=1 Tax=Dryococelus australis TaxID=614101 RepID=A0ABQ9HZW5_9NEOP|nr:hypothetical protein PR048_009441 [Dryococelus australis]
MRSNLKNTDSSSFKDTDRDEIEALVDLMILCAILKSGRENLQSLFSTDTFGRPIFRRVMSLKRCQESYTIGAHACVGEALIPFRGRCRFRMRIPNKQAKYGIKLMCLTDMHNSYLLNSYIYVGKNSDGVTLSDEERNFTKPTEFVLRLAAAISGSNRNITADISFSSAELVRELRRRKLTYTGTLKKNKR